MVELTALVMGGHCVLRGEFQHEASVIEALVVGVLPVVAGELSYVLFQVSAIPFRCPGKRCICVCLLSCCVFRIVVKQKRKCVCVC